MQLLKTIRIRMKTSHLETITERKRKDKRKSTQMAIVHSELNNQENQKKITN
jgi:hypothetical protein